MIASFLHPVEIGCQPSQFLWALPLILIVSFVIRLEKDSENNFKLLAGQTIKLFLSACAVMIVSAFVIFAIVEYLC